MTRTEGTPYAGAISWARDVPRAESVPAQGPAPARVSDAAIGRAVQAALRHGGAPSRLVDVVLVDKETLARMHGQFLGDSSETDVITFDLSEGGDLLSGDLPSEDRSGGVGPEAGEEAGPPPEADGELYVSVDRALEASRERSVSFERELVLYVVHGTLHLCGLDDHDPGDREGMRRAERAVMAELGYAEDPSPHDG